MEGLSSNTVVIKIGTSSLVRADSNTLSLSNLAGICEMVHALRSDGYKVVLVSSGAIGVGCQRLKLLERPKALAQKQALAAIGQVYLMRYYEDFFDALGLPCAQVLLTLDNLANRNQYLNARNTFDELFSYGAVPVVNENDTVAVEELLARFGDNDTLSAQVATLVGASWLFLLTDVPALYSANPQRDPAAVPIREVHDIMQLQADVTSKGTQWGTGGMATKLAAARIATAAGCHTVICQASDPAAVQQIIRGARDIGTIFYSHPRLNRGRKRWIPAVPIKGELWLDHGAHRAVLDRSQSLFSAGIRRVVGTFSSHDAVSLCTADGTEFARGLCNYAHDEVERIKGKNSKDFLEELGYLGPPEIIHRDNISSLALGERSRAILARTLVAQQPAASASHPYDALSSSQTDDESEAVIQSQVDRLQDMMGLLQASAAAASEPDSVLHRLAEIRQRDEDLSIARNA
ncbi:hypothetical protein WJX73_008025 [Symbiochloris irregularis]|uniref:PUA domain-containing protein n=1 Tax=Symbiochloris irregularis TaxID=706552 RepID=A0AAW1NM40_9CHLO